MDDDRTVDCGCGAVYAEKTLYYEYKSGYREYRSWVISDLEATIIRSLIEAEEMSLDELQKVMSYRKLNDDDKRFVLRYALGNLEENGLVILGREQVKQSEEFEYAMEEWGIAEIIIP